MLIPEEFLGDNIGQLNYRRGEVVGMEPRLGGAQAVTALVPLAEMFGYATNLRSATQGRGVFTMEFNRYTEVDKKSAEAVVRAG